jgi:hypothetical protein
MIVNNLKANNNNNNNNNNKDKISSRNFDIISMKINDPFLGKYFDFYTIHTLCIQNYTYYACLSDKT